MGRFLIQDVPAIENAHLDPRRLSAMIVRLILSSREIESKVYDSNPRTGTYVVVLEGTLDLGEREQKATSRTFEAEALAEIELQPPAAKAEP